jgi:peptidoglycan/LPS O-acetylase OafA/YrhL
VSSAVGDPAASIAAVEVARSSPNPPEVRSLSESHWLPGIEVLRGIAAATVVVHHTYTLSDRAAFNGGAIVEGFGSWGVDIFFLLSSFLLCEYFWRPRHRRSIVLFYIRRFFRIAPAYYAVTAILFLFLADHANLFSSQGLLQVATSGTFTHWLTPGTASSFNVDGALWTLTIEMLLYLAIPLMALAVWRRPLLTIGGLVLLAVGYRLYIAFSAEPLRDLAFGSGPKPPEEIVRLYLGRQFPGFVSLFAVGLGARYLVVTKRLPKAVLAPLRRPSALVILALLVPSILFLLNVYKASDYHHWFFFTFFDLGVGLLAVPALIQASRPAVGSLSLLMRAGVWLGKRSYGLYLWHFPVILSVYGRGPLEHPAQTSHLILRLIIIWTVALALAAASYRLIEKPAMDYAKQLGQRWLARRTAVAVPG